MFDYLKTAYDKFWALCKNSGTILLARLSVLAGIIVTAFTTIDWSVLYALFGDPAGFTAKQAYSIGGWLLLQGIIMEVVRRRNTKEIDNVLVSKSTETVATKAIKKPGKLKKLQSNAKKIK